MVNVQILARKMKALSYSKRLEIVRFLKRNSTASVEEISDAINLKPQSTSKHLRILERDHIIVGKRRGMFVIYRLLLHQPKEIKSVIDLL